MIEKIADRVLNADGFDGHRGPYRKPELDPALKIWLEEDGILRIQYPQNAHMTLEAMHHIYDQHVRITTEKRPVLVYAESVASAEYEAQQFASSPQIVELTACVAFIVKSVFTRAMGELFMKFHKPPYPTRIFNNEEQAIAWLQMQWQEQGGGSSGQADRL
jgi:hypothetical protein